MRKKLFSLFMTIVMIMCFSVSAFANEDPYEAILNEMNEKYDVALVYVPVTGDVSIEDYRTVAESLAINQRETLDYMAERLAMSDDLDLESDFIKSNSNVSPLAKTTETVTFGKNALFTSDAVGTIYCTATYKRTNNPGFTPQYTVSTATSASATAVDNALFLCYYSVSSWTTGSLDSKRTMYVSYVGTYSAYSKLGSGNDFSIGGATAYCEWQYNG